MKNLTINIQGNKPDSFEINSFESENSIKLPQFLIDFFLYQNPIDVVEIFFHINGEEPYSINTFYPFDSSNKLSVQKVFSDLNGFFEKKYFPFGCDSGGWQYVVSIQEKDYGKVFFCRMDENLENSLTFLADNFEVFINGLVKERDFIPVQKKEINKEENNSFLRKENVRKGISYFEKISMKYDMEIVFDKNYAYGAAKIFNNNCIIDISVDRYYPDLSIFFINPKTNKEFNYGMVMNQRKVFEKEKNLEVKIKDENQKIENDLKDIAYLMEKYCSDILSGDFSTLEENT